MPTRKSDIVVLPTAAAPDSQGDPGLPMSLELSDADVAKVDAAVRWLNAQVEASGLDLAAEVKRYVIETFFDGDYDRFIDPSRNKPLSFASLCQREDLELPAATLYRLIRIARQVEELPGDLGPRLTVRQHRALLPVTDPVRKVELARRAVEGDLTADKLEDAVREVQPTNKTGRPPLPVLVKQNRQIQRLLGELHEAGDEKQLVAGLKRTELEELAEALRTGEARFKELRGAVDRELKRGRKVDG
ncbi:MAG: hypothetical protein ACOYOB_07040 [Myxococcota bacterium]